MSQSQILKNRGLRVFLRDGVEDFTMFQMHGSNK
jgi:hypothetical protein